VSNDSMISPDQADDVIFRALSLIMGRGRKFSVEDVELGTGIPARTLSAMIAADVGARRRPKGQHLLMLCQFFGTSFTERLLAPIGQGATDLDPTSDAPCKVVATLMRGAAEFADRAADGQFCHRDRGDLADDAVEMIQILTPFAAGIVAKPKD